MDVTPPVRKSEHAAVVKASRWHAIIPREVLTDESLARMDLVVFGMIALWHKWDRKNGRPVAATVGNRWIARELQTSAMTVSRSIKRLIEAGHIRLAKSNRRGVRTSYEFTSPAFLGFDDRGDGVALLTGYSGVSIHVGVVPPVAVPVKVPKVKRTA